MKGNTGDLELNPKLLKEQFDKDNKAAIGLVYAGKPIKVVYYNKESKEYGEYKISSVKLDNRECGFTDGKIGRNIIEDLSAENEHIIEVTLI